MLMQEMQKEKLHYIMQFIIMTKNLFHYYQKTVQIVIFKTKMDKHHLIMHRKFQQIFLHFLEIIRFLVIEQERFMHMKLKQQKKYLLKMEIVLIILRLQVIMVMVGGLVNVMVKKDTFHQIMLKFQNKFVMKVDHLLDHQNLKMVHQIQEMNTVKLHYIKHVLMIIWKKYLNFYKH